MRYVLGATGVALMGLGTWLVLGVRDPLDVAVWLVGGLALHDAVIAPLVFAAGWLLGRARTPTLVRGALVVAGSLTFVALPVLLRPGTPANSSVLPLDYVRNWLLLMLALGVCTAVACALRAWRGPQRGEPAA
ncbi:hypothetical protein ACIBUY_07280 [Streptomyces sp. NPDC050085]|uniref:hypothetical protein n=1 Tax=Streptomyces sp. NPDC050085 TaxID=3365600 RepID=UPI0037A50663